MGRELCPEVFRLVLAYDGDSFATFDAKLMQAERQGTHVFQYLAKTVFAPDAAILVTFGQAVRRLVGVFLQQLRKRAHWQHQISPSPRSAFSTAGSVWISLG